METCNHDQILTCWGIIQYEFWGPYLKAFYVNINDKEKIIYIYIYNELVLKDKTDDKIKIYL